MHSFVDQISALLSSGPVNSIKNNGLYDQLPSAELFSSLLSQYAGSGEDANIAASGGKLGPLLNSSVPAPIEQPSLASESNFVAEESIVASSELPVTSLLAETARNFNEHRGAGEHRNELLRKEVRANNFPHSSENSADQNPGIRDKNVILTANDNVQSSQLAFANSAVVADAFGKVHYTAKTDNPSQVYQSPVNTTRSPQDQQQRFAQQAVIQNNGQVVQRPQFDEAGDIIQQQPNAEVRSQRVNSDIVARSAEAAQLVEHNRPIKITPSNVSVQQNNLAPPNVVNSATDTINILDSRERLPLSPVNTSSNVIADVSNASGKAAVENSINQPGQTGEQVRRSSTHEQFIQSVNTATLKSDEVQSTTLEEAQLVDVRKNSIIASSSLRELGEQVRQAEGRVNKDFELDALARSANILDRSVFKHDYSPVYQQYTNADSLPSLKFVEINIDQKTPVTINIGADVSTTLKTLNAETLLSSPKEILNSGTATNSIKPVEIRNGNEIAEQIAWAQRHNAQQVRISIAPEHLGAIDISIDDVAEGLNIQFVTQNIQAKEALEQFMPRLKEMLEQSGFNLQNANVSQQGDGKSGFNYSERMAEELIREEAENDSRHALSDVEDNSAATSSNQLLDAFA